MFKFLVNNWKEVTVGFSTIVHITIKEINSATANFLITEPSCPGGFYIVKKVYKVNHYKFLFAF